MRAWVPRLLLLAVAVAVAWWLWSIFFPSPEKVIRGRLKELAALGSVGPNEAPLARLANANKLISYCTATVELAVDVPGRSLQTITGRDDLLQAALMARSSMAGLTVQFFDIEVQIGPDRESAVANLTAKIRVPGERDYFIQELKFMFKKTKGEWLIQRIETVKTLADNSVYHDGRRNRTFEQ
jgi:hypothetical protein